MTKTRFLALVTALALLLAIPTSVFAQNAKPHVFVGTATEAVLLGDVQPQGKKSMRATDWARGARLTDTVVAK